MVLHTYDLVVLGDHLGGLAAAALSAKRGKRVLVLEDTENVPEERPMEFLNAICGGPEREAGLGRFFHELGLSPFGPLGDDRIHFRPLHPPLQVVLPAHRINIYQDEVARNWEMEREFGDVEALLNAIRRREEFFRERLFRYRAQRPARNRSFLQRTSSDLSRLLRFWKVRNEAEKETFTAFLGGRKLPGPLADALAGQAQGVFRILPRSLPWTVGLRAIQVLQGGLFQNASGQSGILNGLKEAFRRFGGDCRSLVSLESIETGKGDLVHIALAAGGRIQSPQLIVDLSLHKTAGLFSPDTMKALQRRGLKQSEEEWQYGLMQFNIQKDWRPECMGSYLVVDPSAANDSPTLLLSFEPPKSGPESETVGIEALGLFREGAAGEDLRRRVVWSRLQELMPFLERSLAGEVRFRAGEFTRYLPQRRGWRGLEDYYRTGRRPNTFRSRQLLFLRNENYVGIGLSEGLLTGISAIEEAIS